MKTAGVIPLFRSGDRHSLNSYRPISILSQFVQKLDSFIENNSLLSESRSGFGSNPSTAVAIIQKKSQQQ